jgi:phosphatidylglycerophosphatase A
VTPGFVADLAGEQGTWTLAQTALAFLLFRLFDILKLPPARGLQRLKGGLGILIDDLIAGLQAGGVLILIVMAVARWV